MRVLLIAAMPEEAAPFTATLEGATATSSPFAGQRAWLGRLAGQDAVVATSGIGLAAAAATAAWGILTYRPDLVMSVGTCGGLAATTRVGEVAVATAASYGTADATEFGYERGQVPGQPLRFDASATAVAAARRADSGAATSGAAASGAAASGAAAQHDRAHNAAAPGAATQHDQAQDAAAPLGEHGATPGPRWHFGRILSSDTFVTARNVGEMRAAFPDAVAADMESAATAQICRALGVDWISVRGISDLCGPEAGIEFRIGVDAAAAASLAAVAAILTAH